MYKHKQSPFNSNTLYLAINTLLGLLFIGLIALFLIDFFTEKPPVLDTELNSPIEQLVFIPIQLEEASELTPEAILRAKNHEALKQSMQKGFSLHEKRADKFSHWILNASEKTQVPVGFITALVASESSFRYNVVSSVGAIGPAQVRPAHWQAFCGLDLKDPEQNVLCGAKALHHLYQSPACKEDWVCAFAHYNVGRGNIINNRYPGAADRYVERIKSKLNMVPELWPLDVSLLP